MIVGLGHQAQVGKDTAARILVEKYGFTRLAFADALKAVAYDINPLITGASLSGEGRARPLRLRNLVDEVGWERAKHVNSEVRRFLQALGLAARDNIHPDVWVDAVLAKIDPSRDYVVTDVRFENEFKALDDMAGVLIKITRKNRLGLSPVLADHPSETQLADAPWHHVIANDFDFEFLESELVNVLGL